MASPLQRCNGSMKDVLYEDLYSVYMLSDQPKGQSLPKIELICCILYVCLQCAKWAHCCRDAMGQQRIYYVRTYCI